MKLTDFKILTFDCYGTLIDWESGFLEAFKPLTDRLDRDVDRREILSVYEHYERRQQQQTPGKLYREILAIAYKRIAEEWGLSVPWEECLTFGCSIKNWPAFSDTPKALAYLKEHYQLAVLSNVDNESFAASNEKLGVPFDAIYTAQDIGSYKPAEDNFRYLVEMLDRRGIRQSEILHTAGSLSYDHEPAQRLGLKSCWIDRRKNQDQSLGTAYSGEQPPYDFCFTSLGEMAEAHRALVD